VLICAWVPDAPALPICTLETDYIKIDWDAPFNNAGNINGYRIEIRTVGNVWTQDFTDCDGS
jgi:hypothetical protein